MPPKGVADGATARFDRKTEWADICRGPFRIERFRIAGLCVW
jgi:hypothetical protein